MPTEVLATPRAEQQIGSLTRRHARTLDSFLDAFETRHKAWILLVGPHDDGEPILNVYAEIYRLLGLEPQSDARRDKPPCCDETAGDPPVIGDTLSAILDRAAKLRKSRQQQ